MSLGSAVVKTTKYVVFILAIFARVEGAWSCDAFDVTHIRELNNSYNHSNENKFGKVRVFSRPYKRSSPIPISPEFLEQNWEINTGSSGNTDYAASILREISESKICSSSDQPDLYWGLVAYNGEGQRIFSIYLDRGYASAPRVRGRIDGVMVEVSVTLVQWFEYRFGTNNSGAP